MVLPKLTGMRQIIASLRVWLGVALLLPLGSAANADIFGRAKVTSKYVYRGLIQSAANPAIQAGVDYKWSSGTYVGSWASMVEGGQKRDIEFNYYVGRMMQMSLLVVDMGILNYDFHHRDSNVAKTDVYIGGYLRNWGGSLNWDLEDPETAYLRLQRTFAAPNDLRVTLAVGRQFYKSYGLAVTPDAIKNYSDYLVRTEREIVKGLVVGIDYTAIRGRNESHAYLSAFVEFDLE